MIILTKLFNNRLAITGILPDDFRKGLTIPIPKFKGVKSKLTDDDFRGITVCPVISKIFEPCLAIFFDDITTSRQIGFKKNVGCVNAIHNVKKVISDFNQKNSTVNVVTID